MLAAVLCAAAVVAIGWLDFKTGPDIGLSLLYLAPVAVAGWIGGETAAVVVGSIAGVMWLIADVSWRDTEVAVAISMWNAFSRFVIYISQGVLLALLRRDREKLRRLAAHESVLARTDTATSLPNARAFLEAVDEELERARVTGDPVCVLYFDLDNFKEVNDRFSHAAGDEVLQEVGEALKHTIRGHDVAARLGGDEFAVLLRGVEPDAAVHVGERIAALVRSIGARFAEAGLGATIGVAHARVPPADAAVLLQSADRLMYEGKESGKGTVILRQV